MRCCLLLELCLWLLLWPNGRMLSTGSSAAVDCDWASRWNSSTAPRIVVSAGLSPVLPLLATLGREHSRRALQPAPDERMSLVVIGGPAGLAEELAELAAEAVAEDSGSGGGSGLNDGWGYLPAAAGTSLARDALCLGPVVGLAATGVAAGGRRLLEAYAGGGGGGGAAATVPLWHARVLGLAEYAARPLLRQRNTTWLQQLNATTAAGHKLPAELLTPPLGSAAGPAAAPLLLMYRRDWWEQLMAVANNGSGSSSGSSGGSSSGSSGGSISISSNSLLPPTWPLLVRLLRQLVNRDLDGDGAPDHVLCADLLPSCKGGALLASVLASLTQTKGTSQGFWFNTADLSPAIGGPAMQSALQLYTALAASNAAPFTPGGAAVSRSNVTVTPDELAAGGGTVDPASGAPLCGAVNPLFAAGRCLFTIDWATAALRLTRSHAPAVSGVVGAAPLPGSSYILAPAPAEAAAGGQGEDSKDSSPLPVPAPAVPIGPAGLHTCNSTMCPYAQIVAARELSALKAVLSSYGPPITSEEQPALTLLPATPSSPLLVNRAPLLGEAGNVWLLASGQAVESLIRVDELVRLLGYQLGLKYGSLLQPLGLYSTSGSSDASSTTGSTNTSGSDSTSGIDSGNRDRSLASDAPDAAAAAVAVGASAAVSVAPGVALDLAATDLASVLQALNASLRHPNAALDVQMPYSSQYRLAVDDLAVRALQAAAAGGSSNISGGAAVLVLVEAAVDTFRSISAAFPYPPILLRLYWQSISFTPPPPPEAAPHRAGLPDNVVVPLAATLASVAAAAALAACVAVLFVWRKRDWRRRMALLQQGRTAKPPGAGPGTTLALTDVQNSTLLWEVLSAELMDECMSIHHGIMRQGIELHNGYEAFTEGDAFAVAFYGPDDALGFALFVQMSLLSAEWPPELLEQPDGCELWARRNTHLLQAPPLPHGGGGLGAHTPNLGSPMVGGGLVGGASGGASGQETPFAARLTAGSRRLRQLLSGAASRSQSYLVPNVPTSSPKASSVADAAGGFSSSRPVPSSLLSSRLSRHYDAPPPSLLLPQTPSCISLGGGSQGGLGGGGGGMQAPAAASASIPGLRGLARVLTARYSMDATSPSAALAAPRSLSTIRLFSEAGAGSGVAAGAVLGLRTGVRSIVGATWESEFGMAPSAPVNAAGAFFERMSSYRGMAAGAAAGTGGRRRPSSPSVFAVDAVLNNQLYEQEHGAAAGMASVAAGSASFDPNLPSVVLEEEDGAAADAAAAAVAGLGQPYMQLQERLGEPKEGSPGHLGQHSLKDIGSLARWPGGAYSLAGGGGPPPSSPAAAGSANAGARHPHAHPHHQKLHTPRPPQRRVQTLPQLTYGSEWPTGTPGHSHLAPPSAAARLHHSHTLHPHIQPHTLHPSYSHTRTTSTALFRTGISENASGTAVGPGGVGGGGGAGGGSFLFASGYPTSLQGSPASSQPASVALPPGTSATGPTRPSPMLLRTSSSASTLFECGGGGSIMISGSMNSSVAVAMAAGATACYGYGAGAGGSDGGLGAGSMGPEPPAFNKFGVQGSSTSQGMGSMLVPPGGSCVSSSTGAVPHPRVLHALPALAGSGRTTASSASSHEPRVAGGYGGGGGTNGGAATFDHAAGYGVAVVLPPWTHKRGHSVTAEVGGCADVVPLGCSGGRTPGSPSRTSPMASVGRIPALRSGSLAVRAKPGWEAVLAAGGGGGSSHRVRGSAGLADATVEREGGGGGLGGDGGGKEDGNGTYERAIQQLMAEQQEEEDGVGVGAFEIIVRSHSWRARPLTAQQCSGSPLAAASRTASVEQFQHQHQQQHQSSPLSLQTPFYTSPASLDVLMGLGLEQQQLMVAMTPRLAGGRGSSRLCDIQEVHEPEVDATLQQEERQAQEQEPQQHEQQPLLRTVPVPPLPPLPPLPALCVRTHSNPQLSSAFASLSSASSTTPSPIPCPGTGSSFSPGKDRASPQFNLPLPPSRPLHHQHHPHHNNQPALPSRLSWTGVVPDPGPAPPQQPFIPADTVAGVVVQCLTAPGAVDSAVARAAPSLARRLGSSSSLGRHSRTRLSYSSSAAVSPVGSPTHLSRWPPPAPGSAAGCSSPGGVSAKTPRVQRLGSLLAAVAVTAGTIADGDSTGEGSGGSGYVATSDGEGRHSAGGAGGRVNDSSVPSHSGFGGIGSNGSSFCSRAGHSRRGRMNTSPLPPIASGAEFLPLPSAEQAPPLLALRKHAPELGPDVLLIVRDVSVVAASAAPNAAAMAAVAADWKVETPTTASSAPAVTDRDAFGDGCGSSKETSTEQDNGVGAELEQPQDINEDPARWRGIHPESASTDADSATGLLGWAAGELAGPGSPLPPLTSQLLADRDGGAVNGDHSLPLSAPGDKAVAALDGSDSPDAAAAAPYDIMQSPPNLATATAFYAALVAGPDGGRINPYTSGLVRSAPSTATGLSQVPLAATHALVRPAITSGAHASSDASAAAGTPARPIATSYMPAVSTLPPHFTSMGTHGGGAEGCASSSPLVATSKGRLLRGLRVPARRDAPPLSLAAAASRAASLAAAQVDSRHLQLTNDHGTGSEIGAAACSATIDVTATHAGAGNVRADSVAVITFEANAHVIVDPRVDGTQPDMDGGATTFSNFANCRGLRVTNDGTDLGIDNGTRPNDCNNRSIRPPDSGSSSYGDLVGIEGLEDGLGPLIEWRNVVEWAVDTEPRGGPMAAAAAAGMAVSPDGSCRTHVQHSIAQRTVLSGGGLLSDHVTPPSHHRRITLDGHGYGGSSGAVVAALGSGGAGGGGGGSIVGHRPALRRTLDGTLLAALHIPAIFSGASALSRMSTQQEKHAHASGSNVITTADAVSVSNRGGGFFRSRTRRKLTLTLPDVSADMSPPNRSPAGLAVVTLAQRSPAGAPIPGLMSGHSGAGGTSSDLHAMDSSSANVGAITAAANASSTLYPDSKRGTVTAAGLLSRLAGNAVNAVKHMVTAPAAAAAAALGGPHSRGSGVDTGGPGTGDHSVSLSPGRASVGGPSTSTTGGRGASAGGVSAGGTSASVGGGRGPLTWEGPGGRGSGAGVLTGFRRPSTHAGSKEDLESGVQVCTSPRNILGPSPRSGTGNSPSTYTGTAIGTGECRSRELPTVAGLRSGTVGTCTAVPSGTSDAGFVGIPGLPAALARAAQQAGLAAATSVAATHAPASVAGVTDALAVAAMDSSRLFAPNDSSDLIPAALGGAAFGSVVGGVIGAGGVVFGGGGGGGGSGVSGGVSGSLARMSTAQRQPASQYLSDAPLGLGISHALSVTDARESHARFSELLTANLAGMMRRNSVTGGLVQQQQQGGYRHAVDGSEGLFGFLWRDLNAATNNLATAAAASPSEHTPYGQGGGGSGWVHTITATVSSALQLLYDRLTPAEVLVSHMMDRNSTLGCGGATTDGSTHPGLTGQSQTHMHMHMQGGGGGGGGVAEPELVLRGLRVRVGLHSGPTEAEVEMCVVDGVLTGRYVGDFLLTAKDISDAAVGGMVVLSGSAFRAFQQLRQRERSAEVMLLHVGDHIVRHQALEHDSTSHFTRVSSRLVSSPPGGPPAVYASSSSTSREIYAAVCPGMMSRLALLPSPVRTHQEVAPGCLSAPAGLVAPVFCNVHGIETLLAWERVLQERLLRSATATVLPPTANATATGFEAADGRVFGAGGPCASIYGVNGGGSGAAGPQSAAEPTAARANVVRAALALLRDAVVGAASRYGGYVVASSADGGHWVLVFGLAEAAVQWGLEMRDAMLNMDWPEALLEHELTEEVYEGGQILKRGLRLRIGIDYGRAMVRLVPRSGRLDYVGRPMNRAARIAAKAKAATVLASDAVWAAARPALGPSVSASNLGSMQLKGVQERLELWALRPLEQ